MRIMLCLIMIGSLLGCLGSEDAVLNANDLSDDAIDPYNIEPSSIETFVSVDSDICRENGKPIIRLFSTTWCPRCIWIVDTYDAVVQMYIDEDEIVAHHWELDIGDDILTSQIEQDVPDSEMAVFAEFSPQDYIPAFVFGCKYYRIGNGYEGEDDLTAEAAEFMAVIEALINE